MTTPKPPVLNEVEKALLELRELQQAVVHWKEMYREVDLERVRANQRVTELEAEVAELRQVITATEMRAEASDEIAAAQGRIALKRLATRITPCPKCKQEGESELYLTELVCPFCEHEWSVAPFPPEVVERAIAAGIKVADDCITDSEHTWHVARFNAHWHVIADYLRSEEARGKVRDAILENSGESVGTVSRAAIAALLGGKESG